VPAASPFRPDDLYCVHCHAPAAGSCATCRAIICADCAVLTGGAVQGAAVCIDCGELGRGTVGWRAWRGVLLPVAVLMAALLGLAWLVAR